MREIISTFMEREGIRSERQLAIESGVSQSSLHRFMKGESKTLELETIMAIAQRFGLTVSQLIGEVALDPDPRISMVVRAMEDLPAYKLDMLVAASKSLKNSP